MGVGLGCTGCSFRCLCPGGQSGFRPHPLPAQEGAGGTGRVEGACEGTRPGARCPMTNPVRAQGGPSPDFTASQAHCSPGWFHTVVKHAEHERPRLSCSRPRSLQLGTGRPGAATADLLPTSCETETVSPLDASSPEPLPAPGCHLLLSVSVHLTMRAPCSVRSFMTRLCHLAGSHTPVCFRVCCAKG